MRQPFLPALESFAHTGREIRLLLLWGNAFSGTTNENIVGSNVSSTPSSTRSSRVIVDEAHELSYDEAGGDGDAGTQNSALMSPSKMETLGTVRYGNGISLPVFAWFLVF